MRCEMCGTVVQDAPPEIAIRFGFSFECPNDDCEVTHTNHVTSYVQRSAL